MLKSGIWNEEEKINANVETTMLCVGIRNSKVGVP
jgi:hypothetical protein